MTLTLGEYKAWSPDRVVADPRTAPLERVRDGLVQIASVEGPITQAYLYSRYIKATPGLSKASQPTRDRLSLAVQRAVREGELTLEQDPGAETLELEPEGRTIVRVPGTPPVVLRERGERTLHDIPVSELAAIFSTLRDTAKQTTYTEWLQRKVLQDLQLVRLTDATRARLQAAWDLSAEWAEQGTAPSIELSSPHAGDAAAESDSASTTSEKVDPKDAWHTFSTGRQSHTTQRKN